MAAEYPSGEWDPRRMRPNMLIGRKDIGPLGQFAWSRDPVRIERVQPRRGALAATIDMMAAALAADTRGVDV
jgi:hypothetical protein